jgi:glycosyltransferase involved in cell wall biosynthesis
MNQSISEDVSSGLSREGYATSKSLRVLHMIPALFDLDGGIVGGAERYALELASHMAKEVRTTLLTFANRAEERTVGNLQIKIIGNPRYVRGARSNPIAFAPMWTQLRKADVVHCHQQHILSSSVAAAMCRLTGRRVFVSDLGGGGWDVSTYLSTDNWYHGHLHISEYSRRIFGHNAKPRSHVIYGGTDTERFSPDHSVQKEASVLYVGRLLPHKGVNDLVAAVPAGMRLEIIGQAYDQRFFADLQALAIGKNVIFRQDCDDAGLANAYRRSLCVVLPSVYRTMYGVETTVPELLGQTLLEGMACGIPAICTNVASMPEIVVNGVTGFVVPPNDPVALREKLVWLRDHPVEAQLMGAAARQRVFERFTWPRVVQHCLEIYRN